MRPALQDNVTALMIFSSDAACLLKSLRDCDGSEKQQAERVKLESDTKRAEKIR